MRCSAPTTDVDASREAGETQLNDLACGTFVPRLRPLAQNLDKVVAQAADKRIDLGALPGARLAPDMFTLARQVQIACDLAEDAPPRFADDERTIDEPKARIAKTIDYVAGLDPPASRVRRIARCRFP
jgi:hypothetical protein